MTMRTLITLIEQALDEAPLADFETFGDLDTAGSLRADDLRAVRSEKWLSKVRTQFEKFPYPLNVYVYNGEGGKVRLQGREVDATDVSIITKYAGVQTRSTVQSLLGKLPPEVEKSVSVILIENEGGDRLPLTPWILGHRIAHAIAYVETNEQRDNIGDIREMMKRTERELNNFLGTADRFLEKLPEFKEKEKAVIGSPLGRMNLIAQYVGTVRSMRTGNLSNRGEFLVELMTQVMIQGAVRFQRPVIDEKGVTPPYEGPDADLLALAREQYDRGGEKFADRVLKPINRPQQKPTWTVFDPNGRGIIAGGERLAAEFEAEKNGRFAGHTIQRKDPSKSAQTRYNNYLAKRAALVAKWEAWAEADMLIVQSTPTDDFHRKLAAYERNLTREIQNVFEACVGKIVLL